MGFYSRPRTGGGRSTNLASFSLVGTELVAFDTDGNRLSVDLSPLEGETAKSGGTTVGTAGGIRDWNFGDGLAVEVDPGDPDQATISTSPKQLTAAQVDSRADDRIKASADISGLEAWEKSLRRVRTLGSERVGVGEQPDQAKLAPAAVRVPGTPRDQDLILRVRGQDLKTTFAAILAKPAINTANTQMGDANAVKLDLPAASAADNVWIGRRSDGRLWRSLSDIAAEDVEYRIEETDLKEPARASSNAKWDAGTLPEADDDSAGIVTGAEHKAIHDALDGDRLSELATAVQSALKAADGLLFQDSGIAAGSPQGKRLTIAEADRRWKQEASKPPAHGYQAPVDRAGSFSFTGTASGQDVDYGGQTNAGTATFTAGGVTFTVRRVDWSGDDRVLSFNVSVGGNVPSAAQKAVLHDLHMQLADGETVVDFASDFFQVDGGDYSEYEWEGVPSGAVKVGANTFTLWDDLGPDNYIKAGGTAGQYYTPLPEGGRGWRDLPHAVVVHSGAATGLTLNGNRTRRSNLILFDPAFDLDDHARGQHGIELVLTIATNSSDDFGFGTDRAQTIRLRDTTFQSTLADLSDFDSSDSSTWEAVASVTMYERVTTNAGTPQEDTTDFDRGTVTIYEAHDGDNHLGYVVENVRDSGTGGTVNWSFNLAITQIFYPVDADAVAAPENQVTEEAVFDQVKNILAAGSNVTIVATDSNNRIEVAAAAAPQAPDGLTTAQARQLIEQVVEAAALQGWSPSDGYFPARHLGRGVPGAGTALFGDQRYKRAPILTGVAVPPGTEVDALVNPASIREDRDVNWSYAGGDFVWIVNFADGPVRQVRYVAAATSNQAPVYHNRFFAIPRAGSPNVASLVIGTRTLPLSVNAPQTGDDPASAPQPSADWTPDQLQATTMNFVLADGTYAFMTDPNEWAGVGATQFRTLLDIRRRAQGAATLAEKDTFQWQVDAGGVPKSVSQSLLEQLFKPRLVFSLNETDRALLAQRSNYWNTFNNEAFQRGLRISDLPADGDCRFRWKYAGRTGTLDSIWFPVAYLTQLADLATVGGGQSGADRFIRTVGGQGPPARILAELMTASDNFNYDSNPNCVRFNTRGLSNTWVGNWQGWLTIADQNAGYWSSGSVLQLWTRGA